LANERLLILLLMVVPLCVLGFGLIIKRYNQVAYLKRHTAFLKEINEDEVFKQENQLSGFPGRADPGDRIRPERPDGG
jgi:hypothetical protein